MMFLADPGVWQSTLLRNSYFFSLQIIMHGAQTLIRGISNHKPIILWLIGLSHTYIKHLLIFHVRSWLIALLKRNSLVYKQWYSELWWLEEQKYETFSGNCVPQRFTEVLFNVKKKKNDSIRNILRGTHSVKRLAPEAIMLIWIEARRSHFFNSAFKEMLLVRTSKLSLWMSGLYS